MMQGQQSMSNSGQFQHQESMAPIGAAGSVPDPFKQQDNSQMANQQVNQSGNSQQGSVGQNLARNYMNNSNPQGQQQNSRLHHHNVSLEMLNLKLDAIKSSMETMDLRMKKIEVTLEKGRRSW